LVKKTISSIFEIQWKDNQKAREIDKLQKNDYVKTELKMKVRSQIASYEFLKNQIA
jgi:polyphosphate kinase